MRKFKLSLLALVLAVTGIFGAATGASARDSGYQLRTFNDGGPGGASCQAYLRTWDTPYSYTIGVIHGYNNCDMTGSGTHTVRVTYNNGGSADAWYTFAGHYVSGTQTWDFVSGGQGGNCTNGEFQIRSNTNRVYC